MRVIVVLDTESLSITHTKPGKGWQPLTLRCIAIEFRGIGYDANPLEISISYSKKGMEFHALLMCYDDSAIFHCGFTATGYEEAIAPPPAEAIAEISAVRNSHQEAVAAALRVSSIWRCACIFTSSSRLWASS